MDPEQPGGGGFMSSRIFGIPTIVLIGGIAILAYLYFRHAQNAQAAGSPSTSGGGGTVTTGTTRVEKGAVTINVTQQGSDQDNDTQPTPGGRGRRKRVVVPDVTGEKWGQASQELQKTGLKAGRTHPFAGAVRGERPQAGKRVPKGSTVMLSGGTEPPPRRPPGARTPNVHQRRAKNQNP